MNEEGGGGAAKKTASDGGDAAKRAAAAAVPQRKGRRRRCGEESYVARYQLYECIALVIYYSLKAHSEFTSALHLNTTVFSHV